jgi:hypothetical protein
MTSFGRRESKSKKINPQDPGRKSFMELGLHKIWKGYSMGRE